MLEVKETYTLSSIYDLKEHCWSGALARIDEAIENDIGDEFFDYIVSMFDWSDEDIDLTQVNDFIWFECDDWLEEHGGWQ